MKYKTMIGDDILRKKVLVCDINLKGHRLEYDLRILKKLSSENFDLTFFTGEINQGLENELKINNIKVIKGNSIGNFFSKLKFMLKLRKQIIKERYEEVLLLSLDPLIATMLILIGLKSVTIHATQHWIPNKEIKYKILNIMTKLSKFNIVVHENFIKKEFTERGFKKESIKVINYPINPNTEILSKEECANKLGIELKKDTFYILAFGGTRMDKGIDILVNAINKVNKNVTLIIAGNEVDIKKIDIKNAFNPINKSNKIIYHMNFINNDDVKYYFNIADLVAIPYRKTFFGQSGPLTEAIKYSKPIIGSRWKVIEDTINEYQCGILFEPESSEDLSNAINTIIEEYSEYLSNLNLNKDAFIKSRTSKFFSESYSQLIK